MEELGMPEELKRMLDGLPPLSSAQVEMLRRMWQSEDILHVYASNGIEGSTMSLAETRVVLLDGMAIGGKSLREHLEIIDGQKAYALMLSLAQNRVPITTAVLRNIHRAVVGDVEIAGQWRDHAVYIRGSMHVPPNWVKVGEQIDAMLAWYESAQEKESPITLAAKLHVAFTHIHPFADGNGRTARLLSNLELLRSGYAPVLIHPEQRLEYFAILERCSLADPTGFGDATEFTAYLARLERIALVRYFKALEVAHGIPFEASADGYDLVDN